MPRMSSQGKARRQPTGLRGVLDILNGHAQIRDVVDKAHRSHLERTIAAFLGSDNIVGVGICEKVVKGRRTGTLAICFYVKKKCAPADVTGASYIPPVISLTSRRAILTDVIEIGEPQLDATAVPAANVQKRPIRSGFSISHFRDSSGTLGAIVRYKGAAHVLSNAHVLALSGRAQRGDPILYPGRADGGTPSDAIARLTRSTNLSSGSVVVDAAIAELLPQALQHLDFAIHGATTPLRIAAPRRNMKIVKMGKQSGATSAIVRDVDFSIALPYPHLGRVVDLHGQARCTRYSEGGDSGSLIVDRQTGAIVGLHVGSAGNASFFTPIAAVLSALSITL